MIEPPSIPESVPAPPRLQRADCEAMIRGFRPALSPDSAEFRGGVLLLLVDAYGLNVERLVRRSGLDRDFVARGVRRLIDNGWMAESGTDPRWFPTPAECGHFWLDVEVLLGLAQRRVADDGTPEWARAGEWVKDFDYQGPRHERVEIHNQYRKVVPHDPEPTFEGFDGEETEEATAPLAAVAADGAFGVQEPRDRVASPTLSGFLGDASDAKLLGANARPAADGTGNDAGLLVGDWSSANWLS
jgi:hypothetical protein